MERLALEQCKARWLRAPLVDLGGSHGLYRHFDIALSMDAATAFDAELRAGYCGTNIRDG